MVDLGRMLQITCCGEDDDVLYVPVSANLLTCARRSQRWEEPSAMMNTLQS